MYNDSIKQSIYNWRLNNPDEFRNYVYAKNKEYYMRNKNKISAQKKEYYKRKKLESQNQKSEIVI
jgi:hypothetical protein